jgi:hypothetical protein
MRAIAEPLIVPLFFLTLLCSSALLFLVEPMFAKLALPLPGGTPAVWNACMVCFQAILPAGMPMDIGRSVGWEFGDRRCCNCWCCS